MAKKTLVGIIVSDKMTNTIVVEVTRRVRHPKYLKMVTVTKKFKADTNGNTFGVGDMVKIEETRPMSHDKYFKVIEKIERNTNKKGEKTAAGK
jgi:small subunit ribosomal protein S17